MKTKLIPVQNYALIKPIDEERKTKGGIIIPMSASVVPAMGIVVALGPDFNSERAEGEQIVKVGDKMAYQKDRVIDIMADEEKFKLVMYPHTLCKIEEEDEEV